MRHFLIVAMLICTLFVVGCKIPQGTMDSLETVTYKIAVVEEVCIPMLDEGIEEGEKALEKETDPKIIHELREAVKKMKKVRDILPKIVRNLKQIKKNLEIFNGIIDKLNDDILNESD